MCAKKSSAENEAAEEKVSFFLAWCKRCGNCVAFCPRKALEADQWGHPYLANPERCTSCGLCEMLCPDFAITVGGGGPSAQPVSTTPVPGTTTARINPNPSPERLAPGGEEDKRG